MMKPGDVLEDTAYYQSKYGQVVFATVIEDADSVDFDAGFTVQESDTPCPKCGELVNIRLVTPSVFSGERILCLYCSSCHLLFRKAAVGSINWNGEYTPTKGFE